MPILVHFINFAAFLLLTNFKLFTIMKKMLIVRVTAKGGNKFLLERDIIIESSTELIGFPFSSIIDALDVLYKTVPHDIEFIMSDMSSLDNIYDYAVQK